MVNGGENFCCERRFAAALLALDARHRRTHAPDDNFNLRAATAVVATDFRFAANNAVARAQNQKLARATFQRRGFTGRDCVFIGVQRAD